MEVTGDFYWLKLHLTETLFSLSVPPAVSGFRQRCSALFPSALNAS